MTGPCCCGLPSSSLACRRPATRDQARRLPPRRAPLIVEALARLRARSCIVDGEAVCCGDDGVPSFDRIRYRRHDASVFLYAFESDRARRRRPAP
jgi:ATP-dependent DNA ligase